MSRLGALVLLAGVAGTVLGLEVREEFCDLPVSGHVHASTLLPLKTAGDYQVAWFEGTKEGHPDVAIRGARRRNGVWESVRTLAKVNPVSQHWNPVLRRADDGRIELFFKVGRNCSDWRTYVQDSRDDGNTWSAPRELVFGEVGGGRGPVKNKCLKLKSGRWLAPASTEIGVWRAFADISDDDGRTWHASPPFPIPTQAEKRFGVIQPTFWEDKGGVHAFMRANDGWVWRTDSQDNGETWREVYRSSLENINSGLDCVCASDGRLYLALNGKDPSAGKAWSWGTRNHLELRVSEDGGTSWRTLLILAHDQPRQPDGRITEFSYPAIIEARPGVLALTHTWNRQRIRFLEIELSARSSACSEKDARTEETPFESRVKWIAAQEPFMDGVGHPRWFRAETT